MRDLQAPGHWHCASSSASACLPHRWCWTANRHAFISSGCQALPLPGPGLQVVRVQQAHAVFNAVDAVDGAIDGCMQSGNLVDYLTDRMSMRKSTAEDLAQRVFEEVQVPPGEPISFMQVWRLRGFAWSGHASTPSCHAHLMGHGPVAICPCCVARDPGRWTASGP